MHLEGKCFSPILAACESPRQTQRKRRNFSAKKSIQFGFAAFKSNREVIGKNVQWTKKLFVYKNFEK